MSHGFSKICQIKDEDLIDTSHSSIPSKSVQPGFGNIDKFSDFFFNFNFMFFSAQSVILAQSTPFVKMVLNGTILLVTMPNPMCEPFKRICSVIAENSTSFWIHQIPEMNLKFRIMRNYVNLGQSGS